MRTLNRLALTLQRIEEFLAIVHIEDFGGDAEGGKRVIDDLHFLHADLKAGRKTLPFPKNERRPLDIAYGHDGHFSEEFTELHDRTVDLLDLFGAKTWPLLAWQAEKLTGSLPEEGELRSLYERLMTALERRNIDGLMTLLEPGLQSASMATGWGPDFLAASERSSLAEIMSDADYRVDAPPAEECEVRRMFDSRRVRLLHPRQGRHALAIAPFGDPQEVYPIQCQFGRIEGHWTVVGYD